MKIAKFTQWLNLRLKKTMEILSKGISGVSENSKSTVLKAIGGVLLSLLATITLLAFIKADSWIVVLFVVLFTIAFLVFIFTFLYCLFTNPNLLRSEKHIEQMKAIEKGFLLGDDKSGMRVIKLGEGNSELLIGPGKE